MAYLGIENLTNETAGMSILKYPLSGDPYFYFNILCGLWLILTLTLFFRDKEKLGISNFISALAVVSFAITVLGYFMSLMEFITSGMMGVILALSIVFIAIWFISS